VLVTAGGVSTVNENDEFDAICVFDASVTCDAITVTVQVVLAGSGDDGVSVNDDAGEELWLNDSGVPVGHSILNALAVAVTDLEKLTVIVEPAFTSVAVSVGTVVVTAGGVSTVNENE
jgi:hypothetical protein